jgi:5-dehydro-2-deoxygluconokinase
MEPFDVITMGRIGVDLYPEDAGRSLADVRSFRKFLGGSPVNVAVAAARLGVRAATVTKVGEDQFGAYLRAALEGFGVDTRWVGKDPTLRTPIVFCELRPPDSFPLLFYREPKAPDMNITMADLDLDAIRSTRLLWTTGTGLSDEPSRSTMLAALKIRAGAGLTVHDLDHRPMFWADDRDARRLARAALEYATVVVGNQDEVAMVVGTRSPEQASRALLELGVDVAIVKRGPYGVLVRTADELIEVDPIRLDVVNGLGAGDAFGGALVYGLLAGEPLEVVVRRANAAGALVASRLACADDMPYLDELTDLLAEAQ